MKEYLQIIQRCQFSTVKMYFQYIQINHIYKQLIPSAKLSKKLTFPFPKFLVGVFTEIKIKSASKMALLTSLEKNKLFPLHVLTTSSKPGCNQKNYKYKLNHI